MFGLKHKTSAQLLKLESPFAFFGQDLISLIYFRSESSSTSPLQMTLLDGTGTGSVGGNSTGNSGNAATEITTLSRPLFHRNGSATTNAKKHLSSPNNNAFATSNDINANNTSINNENYTSSLSGPNRPRNETRRVPELCNNSSGRTLENLEEQQHDLKKWSELCKMNTSGFDPTTNNVNIKSETEGASNNHGDNNNNHASSDSGGSSTVLPEMDFSN